MATIFDLVGKISTQGIDLTNKNLKKIDARAAKGVVALNKMGKSAERLGKSLSMKVTAPLIAAGAGIAKLAGETGKYADKILDLEQVTGLSSDTLQEFENVARVAGVNFEGLTNTVSKFTNYLPDIQKGTGPAADAVKKLGVNVFDSAGNVRDMNTLFPELINKLRGVENIAERNAIAQDLFGRSMADLAPVLGLTTEQMDAARKEAHDLGLVMGKDALMSANDYRISMERLKGQFTAVWRNLASQFIPVLKDVLLPILVDRVIPAITALGEKIGAAGKWFTGLSDKAQGTIMMLVGIVAAVGPVLIIFGKMVPIITTIIKLYKLWTASQLTLNAAINANALGLIIIGIAAVITGIVLLIRHWDWVKEKALSVWDGIVYGIQQAISFLKEMFLRWVRLQINGLLMVAKHIPFLGDKLKGLKDKVSELIEAEGDLRYARKETRAATVEYEKALKKQTEAVEADTKATDENTEATNKNKTAKKEAIKIGAAEIRRHLEWKDAQWAAEKERQAEAIREEIAQTKAALDEKQRLETEAAEKVKQLRQNVADFSINAINKTFEIFFKFNDNKQKAIDNDTALEKERILNSVMSEEEKQAALANLEAEAEVRKRKLRIQEAKREKKHGLFTVAVDTARAIMKGFADLGPIGGAIAAVITAAQGIAQAIAINKEPLPMAEGGLARSRRGGILANIAEGGQDEFVLPMRTGLPMLIDGIVDGLRGAVLPSMQPAMAAGGVGTSAPPAASSSMRTVEFVNRGTVIADKMSVKRFAREIQEQLWADEQRRGERQ